MRIVISTGFTLVIAVSIKIDYPNIFAQHLNMFEPKPMIK
jgi:hypothetical protein